MTGRRAVFLDRDGVINVNRSDYVKSEEEFAFLPGALEALRRLASLPLSIVIVSNQSAIGRGLISASTVDQINQQMVAQITAAGGRVDLVRYCPHRPDEGCHCRKPEPGLLVDAANLLGLDLPESYMIGDAASDIEAAQRVGCRAILVRTGRGQTEEAQTRQPFVAVDDIMAAVRLIEAWEQETGQAS
jgi:D-glycero-D-manno-heptose 1,7-bisphosphate phosphatase